MLDRSAELSQIASSIRMAKEMALGVPKREPTRTMSA